MTTPLQVLRAGDQFGRWQLSKVLLSEVQDLLRAALAEQTAEFDGHAEVLATYPLDDANARDRAIAALHMFRAREAIEDIQDALVRIESASFGVYEACARPIARELIEARPHARTCGPCESRDTVLS